MWWFVCLCTQYSTHTHTHHQTHEKNQTTPTTFCFPSMSARRPERNSIDVAQNNNRTLCFDLILICEIWINNFMLQYVKLLENIYCQTDIVRIPLYFVIFFSVLKMVYSLPLPVLLNLIVPQSQTIKCLINYCRLHKYVFFLYNIPYFRFFLHILYPSVPKGI